MNDGLLLLLPFVLSTLLVWVAYRLVRSAEGFWKIPTFAALATCLWFYIQMTFPYFLWFYRGISNHNAATLSMREEALKFKDPAALVAQFTGSGNYGLYVNESTLINFGEGIIADVEKALRNRELRNRAGLLSVLIGLKAPSLSSVLSELLLLDEDPQLRSHAISACTRLKISACIDPIALIFTTRALPHLHRGEALAALLEYARYDKAAEAKLNSILQTDGWAFENHSMKFAQAVAVKPVSQSVINILMAVVDLVISLPPEHWTHSERFILIKTFAARGSEAVPDLARVLKLLDFEDPPLATDYHNEKIPHLCGNDIHTELLPAEVDSGSAIAGMGPEIVPIVSAELTVLKLNHRTLGQTLAVALMRSGIAGSEALEKILSGVERPFILHSVLWAIDKTSCPAAALKDRLMVASQRFSSLNPEVLRILNRCWPTKARD